MITERPPREATLPGLLLGLLRGPGFRRLLTVRLLSQLSDGVFQASLATYALFSPDKQSSPAEIAVALAVVMLPFSVVGPFTGVMLDRWRRRQVLLTGNLLRCAEGVVRRHIAWQRRVPPTAHQDTQPRAELRRQQRSDAHFAEASPRVFVESVNEEQKAPAVLEASTGGFFVQGKQRGPVSLAWLPSYMLAQLVHHGGEEALGRIRIVSSADEVGDEVDVVRGVRRCES